MREALAFRGVKENLQRAQPAIPCNISDVELLALDVLSYLGTLEPQFSFQISVTAFH